MVRPDRASFRALAVGGAFVPLVREVLADLDTPLATFLKVDDGETAFLFESAEGEEHWGRFSFIGIGARAVLTARAGRVEIRRGDERETIELPLDRSVDPLNYLRTLLAELRPVELPGLPRFAGGAVGYVSYDWVRYVEQLPEENPDTLGIPDCYFTIPRTVLVHDRKRQRLMIIHPVATGDGEDPDDAYARGQREIDRVLERLAQPLRVPTNPLERSDREVGSEGTEVRSNTTRERYREVVEKAKAYIRAGDIFQVVPSQRLRVPLEADPLFIYRQLRVLNPSPYLFFLRCADHVVVGSSPEVLVRLEGDTIELRPIAGTRPRGETPEQDRQLEAELLADPKELAEHVMLVDLGRNDIGRVAEIGSVEVDEFQVIERYSHVMHIVSNIRGKLKPDCEWIDLLRATFPAGTLTGAPKIRAMEIIEELEPERRGLYGGSVGYIDYHGNMDMCIAIRTLLIKDDQIYVQAGGGVVADSDPELEYQESLHKARGPLQAIELASRGEGA
ncbi:MAG: anthranilate synthase component I [Myxococcota bacterium]